MHRSALTELIWSFGHAQVTCYLNEFAVPHTLELTPKFMPRYPPAGDASNAAAAALCVSLSSAQLVSLFALIEVALC